MNSHSTTIGELVRIIGGGTPPRSNARYYGGDIPWVTPKDMKSREIYSSKVKITQEGVEKSTTRIAPQKSVLIVVRSGVLKHTIPVAVNQIPVAINQDIKALICSDKIIPEYLSYFIRSQSRRILQWVRATTADNFPISNLEKMEITLPPVKIQEEIVQRLDEAASLQRKRRRSIELLDELTQSVFLDMFGDTRSPKSPWDSAVFSEALTTPPRNGLSPSKDGSISASVLTLSSVTGERFNPDAQKEATFKTDPPSEKSVRRNDFLVCRGNGNIDLVGRGYFPTEDMPNTTFPDTIIASPVDQEKILPKFLEILWKQESIREQIKSVARTTNGTFKINQRSLEGIKIIIPPIKIQREFSERVRRIEALRAKHQTHLSYLDELFASVQQRAFDGTLWDDPDVAA